MSGALDMTIKEAAELGLFDGLSTRAKNVIVNNGVMAYVDGKFQYLSTLRDLSRLSDGEWIRQPNFGKKSLPEVKALLDRIAEGEVGASADARLAALELRVKHLEAIIFRLSAAFPNHNQEG